MTSYIIYKIVHKQNDSLMYIGSTTNFKSRANHHRLTCTNPKYKCYDMYLYQVIREHGGWENWEMSPLEVLENSTKKDAAVRQQDFIYELNPSLNKHNAFDDVSREKQQKKEPKVLTEKYKKNRDNFYKWIESHPAEWKEHYMRQAEVKNAKVKERRQALHNSKRVWRAITTDFRNILIADHVLCRS